MSTQEDMDYDMPDLSNLTNGLQANAYSSPPALRDSDIALLENLVWEDFLTSPGPNNGFPNLVDSMETNTNPNDASQNLNIRSPSNDPLLSGAPTAPQAHAVYLDADNSHQSERIDSSLRDIDPMQLDSSDAALMLLADPTALGESLGSIELESSRNDLTQQHDQAQGPAEGRMAAQRQTQALPDSSQTQMTSRMSQNNSSGQPAGEYFADYILPDWHHFKVSVKFMSTPILERDVENPGGCLLHYQPTDQPAIPVSADVERIPIQEQEASVRDFRWVNEKQKRFTKLILQSFDRGVEFSYQKGNIYAKRKSNTKLFWHSNAEQPGHALELKRNEKTEVFNWENFETNLKTKYALGKQAELKLPAIWFSFAQKWDSETSPITTKLVWARVDPARACEMVKNVHPDVTSTSILESLHTSMFGISHEASH